MASRRIFSACDFNVAEGLEVVKRSACVDFAGNASGTPSHARCSPS